MLRLPPASLATCEFQRRGFALAPAAIDEAGVAALRAHAERLAHSVGLTIERRSSGGRLAYEVVTGERIATHFQELFRLYRSRPLIEWLRATTKSSTLTTSPHLRSSININVLRRGQQYPWHLDAAPYTALLFLTSVPAVAGGQLLIRDLGGDKVEIEPNAGDLIVMDGSRCAHAVAPLRQVVDRISVPMVYPIEPHERPADLDTYLYGDVKSAG